VDSIDSREDPYITYAAVAPEKALWGDAVALYDEKGLATANAERARTVVVRAPLTRLKTLAGTG
jgi:hypothetical protein